MKPTQKTSALADIVRLVPLLFHRLRAVGDDLHADKGITTAARPVSRQHIQVIVDSLEELGLAKTEPNPAHKRSSHIVLSAFGQKRFTEMRVAELKLLTRLTRDFTVPDLETTRAALAQLADQLDVVYQPQKETVNDTSDT
jgi:hypothetical protein